MAKKKDSDAWKESCAKCRFFLLDDPKDEAGYCRRYPPKPVTDDEGMCFTFPVAATDEWCGEFRPVEN